MDDVPNEILLNIFHQLDRRELKVILNVCKRWRELIITSSTLMRQLPLTLVKEWLPKIEFMGNFGEFVKEVNFEYCSFESLDEFKNILNLLPCVEVLRINYVYIKQPTLTITPDNNNTIREVELPEFPFLRRLELSSKFWGYITQVDGKILKHLNTNRLQFLKIHLPMQKFSSDFIEFLCKQTNLKTLQVHDDFIDSFVFDDFVDFVSYQDYISSLFEIDLSQRAEFQLKSLSINYRGDHRENFERFLNSQSDLEELEFCKYDDDFVKFKINFDLIKNLNVRKLNLYIDFLPSNNLTNVENFVNPSVHDLTLMGYNNDPAMFNYLLTIFPNVRTLRLEYMNEFNCDSLVELKHLEVLMVDHFKVDCMLNVRIEKLRALEIKHLYPFVVTDFENVVENNPKIEQLVVQDISHFNTMCSIRNALQILVKGLKFLQQLTVIQNQDSHDCIKLLVDNRKQLLQMTPITMTLCRDVIEHLKNFYSYKTIKIL